MAENSSEPTYRLHKTNTERVTFWADSKDKARWSEMAHIRGETLTDFFLEAARLLEKQINDEANHTQEINAAQTEIAEIENKNSAILSQIQSMMSKIAEKSDTTGTNPINSKLLLSTIRNAKSFDFEAFSRDMTPEEKADLLNSLSQLKHDNLIKFDVGDSTWKQA